MAPVVKGGIASAIVVPPLAGGCYLYFRDSEKSPEFLISLDTTAFSAYKGKFGEEYAKYMVHPNKSNEWWWGDNFKGLSSNSKIEEVFSNSSTSVKDKKIDKGYSDSEDTALNKVCDVIYKETISNIDDTGGDGKYKADSVWKNCSPLKIKPKTIKEKSESTKYNGTDSKFGKAKEDKLIAIVDTSGFWDFQEDIFWKKELTSFKVESSPFKKQYKERDKNKKIKDLCEDAYGKSTTDVESYKSDVWEFCSLKGTES